MTPSNFPQATAIIGPPEGMDESQVASIPACRVTLRGGNNDGAEVTVVAWKPDEKEVEQLLNGSLIYLLVMGSGLPPHALSTEFPLVLPESR